MRLLFLGTAAAEGYPGIFCDCANCREARALGGRNIRMRSALLVNNDLLIDFGPDILAAAQRFNLNLSQITTGLVTHAHEDHFHPSNFHMRHADFSGHQPLPTVQLFCPTEVTDTLHQMAPDLSLLQMEAHTVHAFDCWNANGYTFEAFHAYHAVGHYEALFYSINDGQHAFLYATDTGPFPEDTWQSLSGKSFDVIILEETMGTLKYTQHLDFEGFLAHAERMRAEGMLRPGGRIIAHHMSHSSNPVHAKVEAVLCPHGIEVAYDGLEVVI
jgi:phosphoribosyl 1,2-cyclic phosphate phosphodiesterase